VRPDANYRLRLRSALDPKPTFRKGAFKPLQCFQLDRSLGGKMTERQLKAGVLICVGLLLIVEAEPTIKWFSGAPPLEMGFLNLLSPLGLIILVVGIYRASTKGKQS